MLINPTSNESSKANIETSISNKTLSHIVVLYEEFDTERIFGRSNVEMITGLKSTRASELIKLLVDSEVIVPVTGHGKGKYRFQ